MDLTLTRTESPGMYNAVGGKIRVSRTKGRTWSARNGATAWTLWTAYLPALLHLPPEAREVAVGPTLAIARANLAKWIDDSAAGSVGPRSRYGWHGDARPAPVAAV